MVYNLTPLNCICTPADLSRTLGRESESRKRKAAVVPTEFYYSMGNEGTGDLDVPSEDCYRVSKEIENLRSQLALKKKELKCYQQNKKLRVELDLKVKDVECLRKENEELKTQNKDLQENIVQILDSQIEFKKRHFQQTESLRTRLELSNARLEEETKNLHERNSEETCCLMSHPSSTNVLKATLEDEVRNLKARDEDHLKEITDIWKQLHVRDQEVKDFSAALEIFNSKMTAAVKAVSDAEKAFHPEKVVEPHDPEGYLDRLFKDIRQTAYLCGYARAMIYAQSIAYSSFEQTYAQQSAVGTRSVGTHAGGQPDAEASGNGALVEELAPTCDRGPTAADP